MKFVTIFNEADNLLIYILICLIQIRNPLQTFSKHFLQNEIYALKLHIDEMYIHQTCIRN
jgi:hypothetical protein